MKEFNLSDYIEIGCERLQVFRVQEFIKNHISKIDTILKAEIETHRNHRVVAILSSLKEDFKKDAGNDLK